LIEVPRIVRITAILGMVVAIDRRIQPCAMDVTMNRIHTL
jgi:hypothetical protein